jgi:hypothetical protein
MVRVHNFNVSRDGYAAGEGQSLERPFGQADPTAMFSWTGATASWPTRTDPRGSRGLDDYLVRDFHRNVGAEIMGRNKFSPHRGPWEDPSGRRSRCPTRRSSSWTAHPRRSCTSR